MVPGDYPRRRGAAATMSTATGVSTTRILRSVWVTFSTSFASFRWTDGCGPFEEESGGER